MSSDAVDELARKAGIQERYTDFYGNVREVPRSTKLTLLSALGYAVEREEDAAAALAEIGAASSRMQPVYVLPAGASRASYLSRCRAHPDATLATEDGSAVTDDRELASGYYALESGADRSTLILTPPAAYLPPALEGSKRWGIATQLYSLRSARNWGMGDFSDLAQLARISAEAGASAIAVNPLHELHLTNASSASPYSPTSRLYLNVLYIDVTEAARLAGVSMAEHAERAASIARLRESPLVDYVAVARLKLQALREVFAAFPEHAQAREEFADFCTAGAEPLRRLAIYEALMERFAAQNPHTYGWMQWPPEYRDPRSAAVAAFADERHADVEFFQFTQWVADVQLGRAAEAAREMGIGLYRDLAVGVDANSADVWGDSQAFCLSVSVGAPPDPLNTAGQDWSLPPLNPRVLRERAYRPFIELLRANMRHAGALRIDHVMALMRLFCIPRGRPASEGAYVDYPFEEMLGVLALESMRNRCMIVGEDLGTVPPGFRERIARMRIFGCRLLYFEREDDGRFREPEAYTPDAVASTGTHDLPPLAGFWRGDDIETRRALGMHNGPGEREREFAERRRTKKMLLEMMVSRGDLGTVIANELAGGGEEISNDELLELVLAAYRILGRSAARLLLVQVEDILLQREQVNTPGTFDEVPNWRHKVSVPLEQLAGDARFVALAAALRQARAEGGAR